MAATTVLTASKHIIMPHDTLPTSSRKTEVSSDAAAVRHNFTRVSATVTGEKSHQASPAGGLQDTLARSGQAATCHAALTVE